MSECTNQHSTAVKESDDEVPVGIDIDELSIDCACPICGSGETVRLGSYQTGHHLDHCMGCDVQFFDPLRNPGPDWYEANYRFRDIVEIDAVNWNHRQLLRDRPVPRGSILDIGCGTGGFLAAAQRVGYRPSGLDFDAAGVRAARERLGVEDVHAWTLEQFQHERPHEQFDVVTAFEVLEHQDRPAEFLRGCWDLTKPGGYFAVSVPFRDRWPAWNEAWDEPPHHLTRWSKRALVGALSRAGFQLVDIRTGWIASGRILKGKVRFGQVGRLLDESAVASDEAAAARLAVRAERLDRAKSLVFDVIGTPVDAALRMAGASGIDMYALAVRPTR